MAAGLAIALWAPALAHAQAADAGAYRTSEWSDWGRKDGVEFLYGWGWNPHDPRYDRTVDARFQLRLGLAQMAKLLCRNGSAGAVALWIGTGLRRLRAGRN